MALMKMETHRPVDLFDQMFGRWPDLFRRPLVVWPDTMDEFLKVEQFHENGTLVVRAEIAGIDPDKDVEVTVTDGTLHIVAERREEESAEEKEYVRKEFRYGSFSRAITLPEGVSETDITATYKDGILEVRVPVPEAAKQGTTRISVNTA